MSGGNCHVAAIQVAPGSSEVIAHGNRKNPEVQNPLLVALHTYICLLRLLISSSTEYSLCPERAPLNTIWRLFNGNSDDIHGNLNARMRTEMLLSTIDYFCFEVSIAVFGLISAILPCFQLSAFKSCEDKCKCRNEPLWMGG